MHVTFLNGDRSLEGLCHRIMRLIDCGQAVRYVPLPMNAGDAAMLTGRVAATEPAHVVLCVTQQDIEWTRAVLRELKHTPHFLIVSSAGWTIASEMLHESLSSVGTIWSGGTGFDLGKMPRDSTFIGTPEVPNQDAMKKIADFLGAQITRAEDEANSSAPIGV